MITRIIFHTTFALLSISLLTTGTVLMAQYEKTSAVYVVGAMMMCGGSALLAMTMNGLHDWYDEHQKLKEMKRRLDQLTR